MEVVVLSEEVKEALPIRLVLAEMGYSVLTMWGDRGGATAIEDFRFIKLAVVSSRAAGPWLSDRVRWIGQARPGVPILVVVGGVDIGQYEALLDAGATQVLIEPLSSDTLRSHVLELLPAEEAQGPPGEQRLEIVLRPAAGTARFNGRQVRLSPTEIALLLALARVPGQPVPRIELAAAVPGRTEPSNSTSTSTSTSTSNAIDVYVARLRAKLSAECIRTIRGGGYLLEKRVVLTTEDTPREAVASKR